MKLQKLAFLAVVISMLATAGTGCKKKPLTTGQPEVKINVEPPKGTGTETTGEQLLTTPLTQTKPQVVGDKSLWDWEAPANTVYFAFDKCEVRTTETAKIAAAAKVLEKNPACAVRIEGNCDERGSAEYNRGLGQRRAETVREALVKLGIAETRIDTLSNGLEKPAVKDAKSDEEHAKNRNGQLVIGPRK